MSVEGPIEDVDLGTADGAEVDLGDAALDDLMNEAETLMHDLEDAAAAAAASSAGAGAAPGSNASTGEASGVADAFAMMATGNFSIDDDEDDDDEGNAGGGGPVQTSAPEARHEEAVGDDHPLSAVQLSVPIPAGMMSAASAAAAPPTITTATSASNSMPFANGGGGGGGLTIGSSVSAAMSNMNSHLVAPPSMDAFTKRTSVFASNLASIAQRGIAQVTAATGPVHPMSVLGGPSMHQPQLHPPGYPHPSPGYMGGNAGGAVGTPSPGMPTSQVAGAGGDLDKEQKQRLVHEHVGDLLPGERVIMFLSNLLHVSDTSGASFVASQSQDGSMWCCVMTYYRLILFSTSHRTGAAVDPPPGWDPKCWPDPHGAIRLVEMPLASMDRVEKTVYQAAGCSYMGLVITGKDCGRRIQFTSPSYADTGRSYESLNTYAFPGRRNLGYLFAFESKRGEVMASVKVDETTGQQQVTIPAVPKRFDPLVEFPRLLQSTGITQSPWAMWRSVNATYLLSPSYPSVLVGPASLDEAKPESLNVIRQCAVFRSEQRLPSLTWCGPGGASLWRSSQPRVGLQGNRSSADELFLRHISESARGANAMADPPPVYPRSVLQQLTGDPSKDWVPEPGCGLKIVDLRPRSAAMANRTAGYGYENTSNYSNCTLQFCNVQNIHAVRDSYQKLCSVCNGEATADVSFGSLVEDTKWLAHVRTILAASWEAAYWVHVFRMPVLVHCSHGWDRTSQVACLAQLFLDPYYRTRHGFGVLVEKDFMSFGHPFHLRSAHGEGRSDVKNGSSPSSSSTDEGQISPIFVQFLDCVYQLVHLYPGAFEFNAEYLLELSFHVYSCRFGNMLCDTERERETLAGIRQRTHSLWDHLETRPGWINPHYVESPGAILMPLPTLLRSVGLWRERHCFFSPKPTTMRAASDSGGGAAAVPAYVAADGGASH